MPLVPLLLALAQGVGQPVPPTEFDEVIELELTAEAPTATAEYFIDFQGTLHLWTRSELDLSLQVEEVDRGETIARDDDSGGGTTPYVRLAVELNDELAISVSSEDGTGLGALELHVVAAPETDTTREAVAAARESLADARLGRERGDEDAARGSLDEALARLLGAGGAEHSESIARALWDSGHLAYEHGRSDPCRAAWGAALAHRERTLPEDHAELLAARGNMAVMLRREGELDRARRLQEAVLAAFERTLPEDHPDILVARGNLANTIWQEGDLARARGLQEQLLEAYERTLPEDHPDLLRARGNLANTIWEQGELARARQLHESVLEGYERTLPDDHPALLRARANLANTISDQGDLAAARVLLEAVLDVYERTLPADHPDLLTTRGNLAIAVSGLGDLEAARALQEAVLEVSERVLPEDHPDLLRARTNLAATMVLQGDLPAARALEAAVLEALEDALPDDHPDVLRSRSNVASILWEQGDTAGARELFEAVLEVRERSLSEDHPELLGTRANLAVTVADLGDLAGARAMQESVLAAYERTLPPDHDDRLEARMALIRIRWRQGEVAAALALVPDLIAGMRARVLGALALAPRQAGEAVGAEARRLEGLLFVTRGADLALQRAVFELQETMRVVALEAARALRRSGDPEIAALVREAGSVRAALTDRVAGADGSLDGRELSRLMLERDRLERQASLRLARGGVVVQPVEVGPLGEAVGTDGVAVAYRRVAHWTLDEATRRIVVGEDHLLAHVLRPDRTLARIDLGDAAEIEALVAAWRPALDGPRLRGVRVAEESLPDGGRAAAEALRERLLDPILAAVGEGARRLHVCADDLVFLVPLDALPLEGGRVGDRWTIASEVSFARLIAPGAPVDREPELLALGGVDYEFEGEAPRGSASEYFAPLAQTLGEVESAGALFRELAEAEPVIVTGAGASKAALFSEAPGKRFLHLATHGWFAPETARSTADARARDGGGWAPTGVEERVTGMAPMLLCGLALAGANGGRDSHGRMSGILTAEELCSLDLSACELAVLSACETNVGIRRAGQGIQSLQAALYAAGARSSITSLWKVDDAATRKLMEHFYTGLWERNAGKAEALWEAKRALREAGAPVRDWAGWVLTGDPD